MDIFIQQLVNGLSIASVIALVAIGITLIFGLTGIVMFAHGELLMLGGYATWLTVGEGGGFFLGLAIAMFVVGAIGFALERGLFRFTLDRPINGFVVSLGLIIAIQHMVVKGWTADAQTIPRPITAVWEVADVRFTGTRVLVIAVSFALILLVLFVMSRTRSGRALRAIAEDRETAALMGIPVGRYITAVFCLGSAVAGIGGALLIALVPITPFIGGSFIIKGFAVAIIGGLGNVVGALIAALVLGLGEAMSAGYGVPEWTEAYGFVLMILMLLLRPQGLLRGTAGASLAQR